MHCIMPPPRGFYLQLPTISCTVMLTRPTSHHKDCRTKSLHTPGVSHMRTSAPCPHHQQELQPVCPCLPHHLLLLLLRVPVLPLLPGGS
jgi:hypothetical protein